MADLVQQDEKATTHLNTFGFLPTQNAKTKKPKEFKFFPMHKKTI